MKISKLAAFNYFFQILFFRLCKTANEAGKKGWGITYFIVPFTGWINNFKYIGKRRFFQLSPRLPWYMTVIAAKPNKVEIKYHWLYILWLKSKIEYARAAYLISNRYYRLYYRIKPIKGTTVSPDKATLGNSKNALGKYKFGQ